VEIGEHLTWSLSAIESIKNKVGPIGPGIVEPLASAITRPQIRHLLPLILVVLSFSWEMEESDSSPKILISELLPNSAPETIGNPSATSERRLASDR